MTACPFKLFSYLDLCLLYIIGSGLYEHDKSRINLLKTFIINL